MDSIFIVGSGGHAKVVIDIIEWEAKYKLVGLVDRFADAGKKVMDYEVIGGYEVLEEDSNGILKRVVVAIGDNWIRNQEVEKIKQINSDFEFVSCVHPSAVIAKGATIGAGNVVMAGTVINSNSRIGDHCIINTGALLDHDNVMGDFSSVAPGAVFGGNVTVGEFSTVSLGTSVIQKTNIGKHVFVGAGSLVLTNIPSYSLVYGVPAEVVRKRKPNEKHL